MMQQLIFDLYPAAPPSFDNFVVGRNDEALEAVRAFVETFSPMPPFQRGCPSKTDGGLLSPTGAPGLFLWGASGSGKTHLLHAACAHASAAGLFVHVLNRNEAFPPLPELPAPPALWLVDDVDGADDVLQGYLFTLYNALRENGGGLLVSAAVPPARLTLREDLRTRLGWGGIYEIVTLRDEDKLQALIAHADARGLRLPAEVVAYLLKHSRRDMRSLVAVLDALDRYSLSLKRPLTLPLVREWLSGVRDQGSASLSFCGKQTPVGFADTPFEKGAEVFPSSLPCGREGREGLGGDGVSDDASFVQTTHNGVGETLP